jgi:hypothetical protein
LHERFVTDLRRRDKIGGRHGRRSAVRRGCESGTWIWALEGVDEGGDEGREVGVFLEVGVRHDDLEFREMRIKANVDLRKPASEFVNLGALARG